MVRLGTPKRGETEWIPHDPVTVGSAEAHRSDIEQPIAVLWVPDIDARHKWREYAIDKPGAKPRPVGFRKPGER